MCSVHSVTFCIQSPVLYPLIDGFSLHRTLVSMIASILAWYQPFLYLLCLAMQATRCTGIFVDSRPARNDAFLHQKRLNASSFANVVVRFKTYGRRYQSHSTAPTECLQPPPPDDLYRDIVDVLDEHSGIDGSCYFGFADVSFSQCAVAHEHRDYHEYVANLGYSDFLNPNGSIMRVKYDGGTFNTRNNIFVFDDMYCHAMGFLQIGQVALTNYSLWSSLAQDKCRKLGQQFSNFEGMSFVEMARRMVHLSAALTDHIAGHGPAPTVQDIQKHAAYKCALGSIGCDMAHCSQNFCMLEDDYIGHWGECK